MGLISGSYARIKNLYDLAANPRRYRNEDKTDLDEYVSPKEWRDQTKPSWGERLRSRKQTAIAFGFIGFIALLIVGGWSRTYIPQLYGNQIVREAIKWLVALPTTWILAAAWQRRKIAELDELTLKIGDAAKSYDGILKTDADGNHLFVPIKGFDWWGMRGRRLTLADLSDDFAEDFAKQGRDPDDPVKIRLEDSMYAVVDKALGDVAVCLTSGLQIRVPAVAVDPKAPTNPSARRSNRSSSRTKNSPNRSNSSNSNATTSVARSKTPRNAAGKTRSRSSNGRGRPDATVADEAAHKQPPAARAATARPWRPTNASIHTSRGGVRRCPRSDGGRPWSRNRPE